MNSIWVGRLSVCCLCSTFSDSQCWRWCITKASGVDFGRDSSSIMFSRNRPLAFFGSRIRISMRFLPTSGSVLSYSDHYEASSRRLFKFHRVRPARKQCHSQTSRATTSYTPADSHSVRTEFRRLPASSSKFAVSFSVTCTTLAISRLPPNPANI